MVQLPLYCRKPLLKTKSEPARSPPSSSSASAAVTKSSSTEEPLRVTKKPQRRVQFGVEEDRGGGGVESRVDHSVRTTASLNAEYR